jgi:hypothetical protein
MNEDLDQFEKELEEANKRLERASDDLDDKQEGTEWDAWRAADSEVLTLERRLAAAKGEPYAVPADFPVRWDVGAPLPFLLCNDNKAFLTFHASEPDLSPDGVNVKVIDPASLESLTLCLVTIKGCISAKLGAPNDEIHHGHLLHGRGLEPYTAQLVINSPWLKEVRANDEVHSSHNPEQWELVKHFILWFDDTTFECLATSLEAEVTTESMESLLKRVAEELLK